MCKVFQFKATKQWIHLQPHIKVSSLSKEKRRSKALCIKWWTKTNSLKMIGHWLIRDVILSWPKIVSRKQMGSQKWCRISNNRTQSRTLQIEQKHLNISVNRIVKTKPWMTTANSLKINMLVVNNLANQSMWPGTTSKTFLIKSKRLGNKMRLEVWSTKTAKLLEQMRKILFSKK